VLVIQLDKCRDRHTQFVNISIYAAFNDLLFAAFIESLRDAIGLWFRNKGKTGCNADDSRQVQMACYNPARDQIPLSPPLPVDHALREYHPP
jgi:hypothetical protein